jgi:hypothetical protein
LLDYDLYVFPDRGQSFQESFARSHLGGVALYLLKAASARPLGQVDETRMGIGVWFRCGRNDRRGIEFGYVLQFFVRHVVLL